MGEAKYYSNNLVVLMRMPRPQEARHSRRRTGLSLQEHARGAAAARGVLPHQFAVGSGERTETHSKFFQREREKASRRRLLTFPFFFLSFRSDVELSFFFSFIQAFPAISTGIYGYPVESATRVAFEEVRKFLDTGEAKEASLVYV